MAVFFKYYPAANKLNMLFVYRQLYYHAFVGAFDHLLGQQVPVVFILREQEWVGEPSVGVVVNEPFYVQRLSGNHVSNVLAGKADVPLT